MRRPWISRALVFIIFFSWTTGALAAFSVGLEALGSAQAAAGQGFGPKLQTGGAMALGLGLPLAPGLAVSMSFEYFQVTPSDVQGGFLYRGYGGGALGLLAEAETRIASSRQGGELRLGGGIGGAAAFAEYLYTTLYFFYPEARAAAFLDWLPAALPSMKIRLSVPLRMQFRRDVGYSFSAGISLTASYVIGGPR